MAGVESVLRGDEEIAKRGRKAMLTPVHFPAQEIYDMVFSSQYTQMEQANIQHKARQCRGDKCCTTRDCPTLQCQ